MERNSHLNGTQTDFEAEVTQIKNLKSAYDVSLINTFISCIIRALYAHTHGWCICINDHMFNTVLSIPG